jgi:hypothetical protein
VSQVRVIGKGGFVSFDQMTWDRPSEYMNDVAYALTWGTPTKQQLLYAAGVIEAYKELIRCPETKRRKVIRAIRSSLGKRDE